VNLQPQQVITTDHPPSRKPHSLVKLMGRLQPPPAKLNAKDGEPYSPLPSGGGVKHGISRSGVCWNVEPTSQSRGVVKHRAHLPELA
jgi:hypothetical protein